MKQKLQTIFPKNNLKLSLLNGMYLLFMYSFLYNFIKQLFASYNYGSWQISEYLINYQGGFVRRGLLGEILFFFAKNFKFNIEWTVKIFCLLCFVMVCVFFVKSFLKKGYTLYILPLSFFLGVHVLSECYWMKRDHIMICFLIAIFFVYKKINKSTLKILIINILTIITLLIHESFAFIALPILFLLFYNDYRDKNKGIWQSIIMAFVFLLPSVCAFLLTMHYHGDMQTAQTIWDSWVAVAGMKAAQLSSLSHGALSSIGWTSKEAFEMHFTMNFLTSNTGVYSVVFWSITISVIYFIVTNVLLVFRKNDDNFTNKDKTTLSSILIFQIICLLPFFLALSCDLGRIIFYWIASSLVIFLLVPKDKLERVFPSFFVKFVEKTNRFLSKIITPSKTTVVFLILFVGLTPCGFSILSAVKSSLIYHVSYVLSEILTALQVKTIFNALLNFILYLF